MKNYFFQWWRLLNSPTKSHKLLSVELLWAWEFRDLIQVKDPSLVILAETLADEDKLDIVLWNIDFNHKWMVAKEGKGGRLEHFLEILS